MGTEVKAGTDRIRALILLHEIGHLTTALRPEPTDAIQKEHNRALLKGENCGNILSTFSNEVPLEGNTGRR